MALSLPAGVVKSFKDIQLNFERIATLMLPVTMAGRGTVTWPGGDVFSNLYTVPRSGAKGGVATPDLPTGLFAFEMAVAAVTNNGVDFRAHTTDGSTPAAGTQRAFYYLILPN